MISFIKKYRYSVISFIIVAVLLSIVHLKVERPMLLAERFFKGGGWLTIILLSFYAGFLVNKMKDPSQSGLWRKRSWLLFSILFFSQLALGMWVDQRFLMSGNLHFPIPALIIGGPLYRFELTFMPILFLSTVILSGPAWCSHLCYFGALDNWSASWRTKPAKAAVERLWQYKYSLLVIIVLVALLFKIVGVDTLTASIFAASFGIVGVIVVFMISPRSGKMIHCIAYCPVGTLIKWVKYLNPFSMKIESNCTSCMLCSNLCRYDALNIKDIQNGMPGPTCTFCGDCLSSCKINSIQYNFLRLKPVAARNLWLIITISLHAVFMGLARI